MSRQAQQQNLLQKLAFMLLWHRDSCCDVCCNMRCDTCCNICCELCCQICCDMLRQRVARARPSRSQAREAREARGEAKPWPSTSICTFICLLLLTSLSPEPTWIASECFSLSCAILHSYLYVSQCLLLVAASSLKGSLRGKTHLEKQLCRDLAFCLKHTAIRFSMLGVCRANLHTLAH